MTTTPYDRVPEIVVQDDAGPLAPPASSDLGNRSRDLRLAFDASITRKSASAISSPLSCS